MYIYRFLKWPLEKEMHPGKAQLGDAWEGWSSYNVIEAPIGTQIAEGFYAFLALS